MKIYSYSIEHGELIGESTATKSPLEVNVYLIPAYATTKQPLPPKSGFVVCFNESIEEWEYVEDNRGMDIHDTVTKEDSICDYLGALKEGYALGKYVKTAEEVYADKVAHVEFMIQTHLDSKAREKGYENILSACSYAGHTNPFQAEGQAFVSWRGNVWAYCYQELEKVQAGTRAEPTVDEFILELPVFIAP